MRKLKSKNGNESSIIIVILALLLVVVLAIVGVIVAKDNKGLATFDGGKVTKAEYKIYYQMFSSYLQLYGYSADEIPQQILYKAAQDKMILTDAKKAGVKLTKEDKEEVDNIFADESYVEYFQQLGFDLDDLRQIYYNDYIIEDYIEKLANEASDEDVKAYIQSKYDEGEDIDMNEYDTSHILFSFTNDDGSAMTDEQKAELKTKAEEVLTRAKNGEDFAALASEFSQDEGTASEGGKYLMYNDGSTVQAYIDAVLTLNEAGQIYDGIVESEYGYHIIKLNAINNDGRIKSQNERKEYANTLFDNADTEKNLVINEELLKEFVLELNPSAYDEDTSSSTDTTNTTDGGTSTVTVDENGMSSSSDDGSVVVTTQPAE